MTVKELDNLQILNPIKKGTISESIPLKFLQRYDYFGNLPKKTESIYTFYTGACSYWWERQKCVIRAYNGLPQPP